MKLDNVTIPKHEHYEQKIKASPVRSFKESPDQNLSYIKIENTYNWTIIDGMPYMSCKECGELKQRTSEYFSHRITQVDGGKESFLDMFASRPSGHEALGQPCNKCRNSKCRKRHKPRIATSMEQYARRICSGYPQLWAPLTAEEIEKFKARGVPIPEHDGGLKWFMRNVIECHITKVCSSDGSHYTIKFGHPLSPSVSCIADRKNHQGRYIDAKGDMHTQEHCRLAFAFTNIQQGQMIKGVYEATIPDLPAAYYELFARMLEWYNQTPQERIAEEAKACALLKKSGYGVGNKSFLWRIVRRTRENDRARKLPNNIGMRACRQCLLKVRLRCPSKLIMSLEPGPFRAHADRIEDSITGSPGAGHTVDNVEFKIYLFSNKYKLTRKQLLWVLLNQGHIELTQHQRDLVAAEYESLPDPSTEREGATGAADTV